MEPQQKGDQGLNEGGQQIQNDQIEAEAEQNQAEIPERGTPQNQNQGEEQGGIDIQEQKRGEQQIDQQQDQQQQAEDMGEKNVHNQQAIKAPITNPQQLARVEINQSLGQKAQTPNKEAHNQQTKNLGEGKAQAEKSDKKQQPKQQKKSVSLQQKLNKLKQKRAAENQSQKLSNQSKVSNNQPQQEQQKPSQQTTPQPEAPLVQSNILSHTQNHQKTGLAVQHLHSVSQPPSQKYLNHLELKLLAAQKSLMEATSKLQSQTALLSFTTSSNKELNSTLAQKNKQISTLSIKLFEKSQEISQKDKKILQLQQELSLYRQIGDVKGLKMRVEELEGLIDVMKKQMQVRSIDRGEMIEEQLQPNRYAKLGLKNIVEKLETTENEKDRLLVKVAQIEYLISQKSKQHTQNLQIMNKMDEQLKKQMEKSASLQSHIQNLTQSFKLERLGLQQKVTNLQSAYNNISPVQSKSYAEFQNNQLKQAESAKQRDIALRQYLKLQLQYKQIQQGLKQAKLKYQTVCRQLRDVKKEMVSRKDYEEVLMRYKKCKMCLEKAIANNKRLSRDQSGRQEMQQRSNNNNLALSQEQNNIKKYFQVFNHHVQESINYFKQTNQILSTNQFQKFASNLKVAEQQIFDLAERNKRLEKLNTIFENELAYKNQLLDKSIADSKKLRDQYYRLQQQKLNVQQSSTENANAKSALRRLEVKASSLLVRNRKVVQEMQQWKGLYQKIKQKYEYFISRAPKQLEMQIQRNEKIDKPIQQKNVQQQVKPVKPTLSSIQTQTEGLNQLYYKQIKQTLSIVKKFPDSIKSATKSYENIANQLEQYKKKYEQTSEKFNVKFRALQNEKNQNDLWRQTTRKQILTEFQQIRQLVEEGRLLNCLRKAKILIEYLEQGEEEQQGEVMAE